MNTHFSRKYLEAFPFSFFWADVNPNVFYYLYEVDGKRLLHRFDKEIHSKLEDGQLIIDLDFNKQTFRPLRIINDSFYIISDTENMEDFNIFKISLNEKTFTKITNNSYTACVYIDHSENAYYVSRSITKCGRFESEICIHNLKTDKLEIIASDKKDLYRIGWGRISPTKNNDFLLVNVDRNNERTNANLAVVNIETGEKRNILPEKYESSNVYILADEVDIDHGFYFVSDCEGFDNLYYFDFVENEVLKLTSINFLTDGFDFIVSEGVRYFIQNKRILNEGQSYVITYREVSPGVISKIDSELQFDGEVSISTKNLDFIWVYQSSLTQVNNFVLYSLKETRWFNDSKVLFSKEGSDALIHSTYKYVSYTSFDGLQIPAYVVIPKGRIKGAIITSFYGGTNNFHSSYQMMAELGFISLSPAVRGTWGHSKEWEDMLKGDLGGSEILDIVWGAKFLEENFDLSSSQIGLEGGSHGGYSTLRALTLPQNFKGQDSKYPFGFGICWAGFADLVDFYKTSNIPDWLTNMLGPYDGNEQLYADRSPINFFDQLNSPLFITHGTKDSRVPPSTMQGFLDKLRKSDKPHYIYLMDGQGHSGGSVEERVDEYEKMFNFLEETTKLGWKVR